MRKSAAWSSQEFKEFNVIAYSDTAIHYEKQQMSSLANERFEDEGYAKKLKNPGQIKVSRGQCSREIG